MTPTEGVTADLMPTCPRCDNVCPPGATLCECGERLTLTAIPKVTTPLSHDHECPCDACYFAELEGDRPHYG